MRLAHRKWTEKVFESRVAGWSFWFGCMSAAGWFFQGVMYPIPRETLTCVFDVMFMHVYIVGIVMVYLEFALIFKYCTAIYYLLLALKLILLAFTSYAFLWSCRLVPMRFHGYYLILSSRQRDLGGVLWLGAFFSIIICIAFILQLIGGKRSGLAISLLEKK